MLSIPGAINKGLMCVDGVESVGIRNRRNSLWLGDGNLFIYSIRCA